jgi:hypothetical protein
LTAALKPRPLLSTDQQVLVGWALLSVFAVWQLNGFYLSAAGHAGALFFWAVDGCQWIVLPAAVLGLLAHKGSLRPKHYGLAPPGKTFWPIALQGLTVFITAGLVFVVARNLSWRVLGPSPGSFHLAHFFPHGLAGTALQLYAAISAGLVESIFFIGLPWLWYSNTREKPSTLHFMLTMSAIFALAHWEHGRHIVIAAFCVHLVLCKWFFRWNTLWPVVLGHTLIDLAVLA